MSGATPPLSAVLLDLDGTLLDTAPDLIDALNRLRHEEGLPALADATVRPQVSNGAAAVVRVGFPDSEGPDFDALRERFLAIYRAHLCVRTRLFPGFGAVLDQLDAAGIPWGIITNKAGWLTEPLLAQLQLLTRTACLLSGDSLPQRKPHPLPLLVAAERIGVPPARCLYLGDALRDMQAAQAAGMVGLVARYGYLDPLDTPEQWPAAALLDSPGQLLAWVGLAAMPVTRRAADG